MNGGFCFPGLLIEWWEMSDLLPSWCTLRVDVKHERGFDDTVAPCSCCSSSNCRHQLTDPMKVRRPLYWLGFASASRVFLKCALILDALYSSFSSPEFVQQASMFYWWLRVGGRQGRVVLKECWNLCARVFARRVSETFLLSDKGICFLCRRTCAVLAG